AAAVDHGAFGAVLDRGDDDRRAGGPPPAQRRLVVQPQVEALGAEGYREDIAVRRRGLRYRNGTANARQAVQGRLHIVAQGGGEDAEGGGEVAFEAQVERAARSQDGDRL